MYQEYSDADTAKAVKAWAEYLVGACQKQAKSVDYAPIPKSWAQQTKARLEAIS